MIRSSPFPLGRGFFMHKISRFAGATVRKPALPESEKLLSCARTVFRQNKKNAQPISSRNSAGVFAYRYLPCEPWQAAGSLWLCLLYSPIRQRHTKTHSVFSGSRQKENLRMGAPQQAPRLFLPSEQAIFPAYRYARFDSAASRHGKSAALKGTAPHFFEQSTPFSASCRQRKA